MAGLLRRAFVLLVAWPVALFWLGLNVRHRDRLPLSGPAIIAANHNSHLDILALYALFPLRVIHRVRPAAAADYFLRSGWLAWFSREVVGIVPVDRSGARSGRDPLDECHAALSRGDILIIFPEGSRGEPERLAALKSGIWHLTKRCPEAEVTPLFMSGLGRSMPRGSFIPLPLFVDVMVDRPLRHDASRGLFMQQLTERFARMQARLSHGTEDPDASAQ